MDVGAEKIARDSEGRFIMIKGSAQQEATEHQSYRIREARVQSSVDVAIDQLLHTTPGQWLPCQAAKPGRAFPPLQRTRWASSALEGQLHEGGSLTVPFPYIVTSGLEVPCAHSGRWGFGDLGCL